MFATIKKAMKLLESAVGRLEPDRLGRQASLQMFECFVRIERMAAAGKALCGRRVATSSAWHDTGTRSPAHWMAGVAGSTVGNACRVLETVEIIEKLPATRAAFRQGLLSEVQAEEIASAAALDLEAELDLLSAAECEELSEFRRECARVRNAARSESERHEYLHKNRQLRHWTDIEGALRFEGRFTPESGAVILAALEPFKQRVALRTPNKDSDAARSADALVALAKSSREGDSDAFRSGAGATIHVRVDYNALVRGQVEKGEICEIPGVGPIPVAAARALTTDCFLAAILMDGKDIRAVSHLGRTIPDRLRTALIERDPICVVPGCSNYEHLEIDHVKPVHRGGETSLYNLARLCEWHHYLKTYVGHILARAPGGWIFYDQNRPPKDLEALQPELTVAQ